MVTTEPEPNEDITTDLVKENPFRYAGYYFDRKTQYYYLQARYYDPRPARFISEDTYEGQIDNPLSLNLYTYVSNNPHIYTDPSGHETEAGGYTTHITKLTLAQVIQTNRWKFFDKTAKGFEKAKQYYFVWYHGTAAYNRLDGAALGHNSYLVYKLNEVRKKGKDLSKLTVAEVDKMSFDIASFWYKIDTVAIGAYSAYGTYGAYKSSPKPPAKGSVKPKLSCNCFTAGTKVQTDEGEKNIEDIEVGDKVLAKDENNPDGELAYKEVTALYRNQRDDIIKLHVGGQIIETTDNHPFWVEGKGWVFADELQVGDKLQKADGSNLTIDKVEFVKLEEKVTVYNFTVADYHTYYVTDIGIWVHNTKCDILDWSVTNKKNQTRWEHAESHTKPNMNRDTHGVFNGNPVSILNQAWNKIQEKGIKPYANRAGGDIYRVPFENAGVGGGKLDNGQKLNYVEIVVMEGTNKLLTGYPVR